MKYRWIALLLILGSCKQTAADSDLDRYSMQYHLEDNKYGVVIVEDEGITHRSARDFALQKAAAVAQENGYRYFIIENESQVAVMKGGGPASSAPTNLYYSMIQSNNFDREKFNSVQTPVEQKPGYRIEFACYKEKPASGRALDACQYKSCSTSSS